MARDDSYEPEGLDLHATYHLSESYTELNQRSLGSFNTIRLSATTNFKTTEVDGYIPTTTIELAEP